MTTTPPPAEDVPRPRFGMWRYDYAANTWEFSEDLLAMWDIPMGAGGPLKAVLERLHPEDLPRIEEALVRAIHDRAPLAGQGRLSTQHGTRTFAFLGYAEPGPDGSDGSFAGYSIDVTGEVTLSTRAAVDGAVAHRASIEQVKGALMVTGGLDPESAFDVLRHTSNTHNVKLAALAEAVAGELHRGLAHAELVALVEGHARRLRAGDRR